MGLSNPLTIEQRIRAAMNDEYRLHILYYNRREGATSAVQRIASNSKRVIVLSSGIHQRAFGRDDVKFIDYNSNTDQALRLSNTTVIADVVPDNRLQEWDTKLRYGGNKLIVLKGFLPDGVR